MASQNFSETDKKKLGQVIGNELAVTYGKKKFYSQKEIKKSLEKHNYIVDVHCWAYCLLFRHYHTCNDLCESIGRSAYLCDRNAGLWVAYHGRTLAIRSVFVRDLPQSRPQCHGWDHFCV